MPFALPMYAGRNRAGREKTDSLYLIGGGTALLGIILLSIGYSDYGSYAAGRDPLRDFVSLGSSSCRIEYVSYSRFEKQDRSRSRRMLAREEKDVGFEGSGHDGIRTNKARLLPQIPDIIKCYESWSTTFSVVLNSSADGYLHNRTDYFERVACKKSGNDVSQCDDCNDFWGEFQAVGGNNLRQNQNELVECWAWSPPSPPDMMSAWDCKNTNCIKMRDPLVEFNDGAERLRKNILAGWIMFRIGMFFCLMACGCECATYFGWKARDDSIQNFC